MPGRGCQRGNRILLVVDGKHAGAACQGKREGAEATEEIGDALGLGGRRQHQAHHLGFRGSHRLHERPGWRVDIDAAEGEDRLPRQHERVTLDRQASKAMLRPQCGHARIVLLPRVEIDEDHLHIDAGRRSQHIDGGLRLAGEHRLQHLPQRR